MPPTGYIIVHAKYIHAVKYTAHIMLLTEPPVQSVVWEEFVSKWADYLGTLADFRIKS